MARAMFPLTVYSVAITYRKICGSGVVTVVKTYIEAGLLSMSFEELEWRTDKHFKKTWNIDLYGPFADYVIHTSVCDHNTLGAKEEVNGKDAEEAAKKWKQEAEEYRASQRSGSNA